MNIRKSISYRSVHAYHKVYVVWGRKPDNTTQPLRGGFSDVASNVPGEKVRPASAYSLRQITKRDTFGRIKISSRSLRGNEALPGQMEAVGWKGWGNSRRAPRQGETSASQRLTILEFNVCTIYLPQYTSYILPISPLYGHVPQLGLRLFNYNILRKHGNSRVIISTASNARHKVPLKRFIHSHHSQFEQSDSGS